MPNTLKEANEIIEKQLEASFNKKATPDWIERGLNSLPSPRAIAQTGLDVGKNYLGQAGDWLMKGTSPEAGAARAGLIGAGVGGVGGAAYGMFDKRKRGIVAPALLGAGMGGMAGAGVGLLTHKLPKDHPLSDENVNGSNFKYWDQRNPNATRNYQGEQIAVKDLPTAETAKLRRPGLMDRWFGAPTVWSGGSRALSDLVSDPVGTAGTVNSILSDE